MSRDDGEALIRTASGARQRWSAAGRAALFLLLSFFGGLLISEASQAILGRNLLELAQAGLPYSAIRALLLLLGFVIMPAIVVLALFRVPFCGSLPRQRRRASTAAMR